MEPQHVRSQTSLLVSQVQSFGPSSEAAQLEKWLAEFRHEARLCFSPVMAPSAAFGSSSLKVSGKWSACCQFLATFGSAVLQLHEHIPHSREGILLHWALSCRASLWRLAIGYFVLT